MLASVLVLLFGIFSLFYFDSRWQLREAVKLYTAKAGASASYWFPRKLAQIFNPDSQYFLNSASSLQYTAASSSKTAQSVPVLAYHGLPNEGIGQIPQNIFAEQLTFLRNNGWRTLTLAEFNSFLKGELEVPDKSFLLTFDDGRKDTFYPADPVLEDLRYSAVIFVITKKSLFEGEDSPYYLSAYELKEMEKSGRWDVESHGRDSHDWYYVDALGGIGHFFSNRFWLQSENRLETSEEYRDRITYDLANAKKDLEDALDKPITAFAFPFGDFGQETANYPEAAKMVEGEVSKLYELAFYQVRKGAVETFNYPVPERRMHMAKRIEPAADWSGEYLLSVLESGVAKELPYEQNSFGPEWISSWGKINRGENLTLKAGEGTGASATLNGSYLWQDYVFTAETLRLGGSNIVLLARVKNRDNYLGCNFGLNKIYIKESVNGVSRNIQSQDFIIDSTQPLSLGIKVKGGDLECLVNGEAVIEGAGLNPASRGGIGIEIWDEKNGRAGAVFDNVSIIHN